MFNLLLICGGPSLERGISLNSVRSFYDNIGKSKDIQISVIFVDLYLNKYFVDETFLYSNTPSDFDFKLANESKKLSEEEFIDALKSASLVMPVIHGTYGEDGTIQKILEENNIPFVASGSSSCDLMYSKSNAENKILRKYDFTTIPKLILNKYEDKISDKIKKFYNEFKLEKVVIKPVKGGSSFGVVLAEDFEDCIEKVKSQFDSYEDILIEEFCKGKEFTVIILQNPQGEPVALIPTEIEVKIKSDVISRNTEQEHEKEKFSDNSFFTTRRKYLPTNETHYYNPPRFSKEIIQKIRNQAEKLFKLAGAKDFLRIDGWLLDNEEIYFSDFNPISGMEQNSFLFQQGAKIGFTHKKILEYILNSSCERQNIVFPKELQGNQLNNKKRVNVLLGGITSERQVSLMSGSNVWLKLLNSDIYEPHPYLLTMKDNEFKVLELSYDIILNHTVEEIIYQNQVRTQKDIELISQIQDKLGMDKKISLDVNSEYVSLNEFIDNSKIQDAYVFLALHGGFGEGGGIQKILEEKGVKFNGSSSISSEICMDKKKTGEIVDGLNLPGLRTAKKISISINQLKEKLTNKELKLFWEELVKQFKNSKVVVKPQYDGCSTGVVVLTSANEFEKYINFFVNKIDVAPKGTFKMHDEQISLGVHNTDILLEEYIEVDKISISNNKIIYKEPIRWTELTIGVLENDKKYHALNPSITIADSGVLSLEEKFQGGMGVNITPPPEYILKTKLVDKLKRYVEKLCETVGINDYCRIDVFVNNSTEEIIIIEINTLPGLSPSTVLFQQGAKEIPSLNPLKLLEKIILNKNK